jgi:hypothetical protein
VAVGGDHLLFDGVTPGTTTFEARWCRSTSLTDPTPDLPASCEDLNGHDSTISGAPPADRCRR